MLNFYIFNSLDNFLPLYASQRKSLIHLTRKDLNSCPPDLNIPNSISKRADYWYFKFFSYTSIIIIILYLS